LGEETGNGGDRATGLARRQIRWSEVAAFVVRRRIGLLIGLGVALRVAEYLGKRPLWMDEGSLAGNILGKSLAGLFGPLFSTQLAPPGFLVLEWLAARVREDPQWTLRLVPLLAGVASVFLFERFSRRLLGPTAACLALAMFALSDDLIYYSTEIKQYSSDVAVALVCALMGLRLASGPATPGRLAGAAAIGAAAVWFSHSALFVLAAVGLVAFVPAIRRREWSRAAGLAAVGATWLASFAGVYAVASRQLGGSDAMWKFWGATFPPSPGSVGGFLAWLARKVLYLFVNPLDFSTPLGPRLSAVVPLALFVIGCVSLGRHDGRGLATVLLPAGLAIAASAVRMYPTHGRLALFLVPFLLVPIAEGAGSLQARGARGAAWAAVLAALLLFPAFDAAYRLFTPRTRDFNPYGDRRPVSLDPTRFPL
jgi:hypothetical protein